MKNFIILLFTISILVSCKTEKEKDVNFFRITGTLENCKSGVVLLKKLNLKSNMPVTVDTALVENGKFSLTGDVEYPYPYTILINDTFPVNLFLENSDIHLFANLKDPSKTKITGSKSNLVFSKYWGTLEKFWRAEDSLMYKRQLAIMAKNSESVIETEAKIEENYKIQNDFIEEFIKNNPGSFVTPFATFYYFQNSDLPLEKLDDILKGFDEKLNISEYTRQLYEMKKKFKDLSVGKPAIDFSLPDTSGNFISLSDFKGQYVLLDFWASWCKPCRQQNPHLKAAYDKYHDKGFTILGISFDQTPERWIEAIKKDKMTWNHVSDFRAWESDVARDYFIKAIPQNILLDKKGVIIGKNFYGQELEKELEKIFGK